MNKTLTLSGAAFLLLGIACGSSDPSEVDASLGHDAQLGSGGATSSGGNPGTGGGGVTSTGGLPGTGGQGVGSGGVIGSGGVPGSGGVLGSGGVIGSGGQVVGSGGAATGGNTGAGTGGASGQVCGGIAALKCPKEQFCEYLVGECSSIADATGTCAALTQVCPAVYQPVCGCDGKTYGNDCERQGAGVSKLADGQCSTTGKMCGGIAGMACTKGQFCDLAPGDCGRIADGAGACAATGAGIACDKIYQPVCGCDGRTYGNDCERQVAGVSKQSDGTCSTLGKMCAGIAGIACSQGQFCDLAPGDCGRIADGAGKCAQAGKDVACPDLYQPVCGCNGKTYGNDCERQAAGVSKLSEGACTALDGGTAG